MFAVIRTGGKQYTVRVGDYFPVEKIESEEGEIINFNEVLLVSDEEKSVKVGAPIIEGAVVTAEVLSQKRDDKIIVFKKKRRQGYRRTMGHRQSLTIVKIKDIKA
jgi:large subunit ribosomal protein L21